MRTYVITNLGGALQQREVQASGQEPNMAELGDLAGLPPGKRSFIHLCDGQSLVLRTQIYVPEVA